MEKESPIIIKFMDVNQNKEYFFQNICSFWQVFPCHGQAKDCIALSLKQSKYYVLA
jgi:hypothetical protein